MSRYCLALVLLLCSILFSANADELTTIYEKIKCPTCAGQSIKDSSTVASKQIKEFVRNRVLEGRSEAEILEELRGYYGEDIVLSPKFGTSTYPLWFFPILVLLYILKKQFRCGWRSCNGVNNKSNRAE